MRAGRLKHRLVVERPAPSRDDAGSEATIWERLGVVWAAIEPFKGREVAGDAQILADLDTKIIIRWSAQVDSITAKWRLRHGGVTYDIAAPPTHDAIGRREIHILCRSGVTNG